METNAAILEKLDCIAALLAERTSDYCDSDEAARIMGISNTRDLKHLYEQGFLPRLPRGKRWVYKKKDCYRVAGMLDEGRISIPKK